MKILLFIARLIKKTLNLFGLDLRKASENRTSLSGAFEQLRKTGFTPATVIDVGAAVGDFTVECYRFFPDSKYILIDPLEENREKLNNVTKNIPGAKHIMAIADSSTVERVLNVHTDLVGSSLYLEQEADLDGVPRKVPAVTLNNLCKENGLTGPYLIKIDVQGAELDVLAGADDILNEAEYVILEVSFFQFVKDGPQFYDIVSFMKSKGFVAYDMFSAHYKLIDGALAQNDIAFVKEYGRFRNDHIYSTPQQREKLTKAMLSYRQRGF
ncbi:hypothetical protein MNBD_DELTA01-1972 [hydrothermal vent metagenome]|uniref:Methyltransferase FkbM domain-containing protein n=1 Tax=hydrothermal vent metagenome TaxID=652676 RepID=A0A3B0R9T5_9ZZZZ